MRSARTYFIGLLCVATIVLTGLAQQGCDIIPDGTPGTGTLKMLVTDKPFPFEFIEEATVTITRVEVRQTQPDDDEEENGEGITDNGDENGNSVDDGNENENVNQNENDNENGDDNDNANENDNENESDDENENVNENENDDENGSSSFAVVSEGEKTFNLLELQNGNTATLVDTGLSAGSYSQVRLIVTSGTVLLTDGREFELVVPSGAQTGIKLHFNFEIKDQEETTLLIDVDLSKAFVPVPGGQINEASEIQLFHFKPSQAVRLTNVTEAGSISGTVTDEDGNLLENVSVTGFNDGLEITSTSTSPEGTFMLSGLEADIYSIEFSLADFEDGELNDVEVTAGEELGGNDIVLSSANVEP